MFSVIKISDAVVDANTPSLRGSTSDAGAVTISESTKEQVCTTLSDNEFDIQKAITIVQKVLSGEIQVDTHRFLQITLFVNVMLSWFTNYYENVCVPNPSADPFCTATHQEQLKILYNEMCVVDMSSTLSKGAVTTAQNSELSLKEWIALIERENFANLAAMILTFIYVFYWNHLFPKSQFCAGVNHNAFDDLFTQLQEIGTHSFKFRQ